MSDFSRDFDKSFKNTTRLIIIVWLGGIVLSIAAWTYLINRVATVAPTPAAAATKLGNLFGQFQKGVEEGKK